MRERQVFLRLPSAQSVAATFALGCPSVGGQRANRLSHPAPSLSWPPASESRVAQRSAQRLKGLQRLSPWSLAGAFTFPPRRRPNPSVKRTVNGGPRLAVSGNAVPPLSTAYLIR